MTFEEHLDYVTNLTRRYYKKIQDKPFPMQILQKRTLNTAFMVLDHIEGIPFNDLSSSMYFYTKDITMKTFIRAYDAQIELAAIDPEKFAYGLHKFYTDISAKIKKEGLYDEFFEFFYRCNRLRITERQSTKIRFRVILAYIDLLCQTAEYLRPNKFDFNNVIVGKKTNNEIILMPDAFPNLDLPSYDLHDDIFNKKSDRATLKERFVQLYAKYGYTIKGPEETDLLSFRDRIQVMTVTSMWPFINEFTYDILPTTPFSAYVLRLEMLQADYDLSSLQEQLKRRKGTLPSNGVLITFQENPCVSSILLKECYYDDAIYMLYKIQTPTDGDLTGFYETKTGFFFTTLYDYDNNPEFWEKIATLVLYLYGCYVLQNPDIQPNLVENYFKAPITGLKAEGYMMGGKLKNVYDSEKETATGTARKGNDDFTTETRAIQGFIRRVPNDKRPSAEARALAESLGYDLAPNETYVRPFIKQVFKLKEKKETEAE